MNKIKLIYIVVLFMLMTSSVYAQHDKYFFYPITGRSVLSRTQGSTWLTLQPGQPMELHPGDLVNVEGDGRGQIAFPDGTAVYMKNNAMITIERYGVNLRMGYIWLNVRRSADVFKVTTPLGSCSVLGTSFDVDVDKYGKAKVRVFHGIVAVRAADDKRNKQLVLQAGMHTRIDNSEKCADKPDKFQHQSIEAAIRSEWEQRYVYKGLTQQRPGEQTVGEEFAHKNDVPSSPKILNEGELPAIRIDEKLELEFRPIGEAFGDSDAKPLLDKRDERVQIIARQRSDFAEMLRQQQLERDSVIGFSIPEKSDMMKDGHTMSFGESSRTSSVITDQASLDREFSLLRNRMLRVQSQIRQTEMELGSLCSTGDASTGNKLRISSAQSKLNELRAENRVLNAKIRELQHKKR